MLQLASKTLSDAAQNHLNDLQKQIDDIHNFAAKVAKAQKLWKDKESTKIGEKTFAEIKTILTEMTVSANACNYCEHNEANDIEHIAPKSVFPELTFVWQNYLLACKQCNTAHKSDKCHVMDNAGKVYEIIRGSGKSPHQRIALINPRIENPTNFILINTSDYRFEIFEDIAVFDKNKAEKTLEILRLNDRIELKKARKSFAKYFYDRLERLSRIVNAKAINEINAALTPHDDLIDSTKSIHILKKELIATFKKDIQTQPHPSVWYAIKMVDSKTNDKWKILFENIPEALDW